MKRKEKESPTVSSKEKTKAKGPRDQQKVNPEGALLSDVQYLELRRLLHELSNVTTGMLMSAGLLEQLLAGDVRRRYCAQINEAGERTADLVRDARALLQQEDRV